jgi:hypothetical protein
MALAGHFSREMLQHYSHIPNKAKQEAIAAMWAARQQNLKALAQNPAQHDSAGDAERNLPRQ